MSIEKLESQLNTLKTMFAEKQKLVSDLDAYGPAAGAGEEKIVLIFLISNNAMSGPETPTPTSAACQLSATIRPGDK